MGDFTREPNGPEKASFQTGRNGGRSRRRRRMWGRSGRRMESVRKGQSSESRGGAPLHHQPTQRSVVHHACRTTRQWLWAPLGLPGEAREGERERPGQPSLGGVARARFLVAREATLRPTAPGQRAAAAALRARPPLRFLFEHNRGRPVGRRESPAYVDSCSLLCGRACQTRPTHQPPLLHVTPPSDARRR